MPLPLPAEGAAGAAADEPAPMQDPLPTDCGCPVTPQMSCVVQDMMCQSDAQCPAGWLCEQEPTVSSAPACAGANCPTQPPAPMPLSAHCRPPYYGAQSKGDLEIPGVPASTNGSGTGTTAP
jgi:hypothetical protein